ncbi:hypothetical protein GQX73_g6061 [Xylaria multiplex]|uniref:Uncharacterized protein n=1 Tax=Xylaria multiplex TaxID=323545 RepID=A0A7C8MNP0_9PEZI|nr:hypothetical protein GQX73_g6061 [Xylaria multiplex]
MEATLTYLAEKSAVSDSYLLEMIHKEAIRVDRHTIELIASRRLYMELCAIELLLDVIWSNPDLNNQIGLSLRIITGVTPSFREDLGWAGARKLYVEHIDEVRRRIRRFIMLFPDGSAAKHPKPLYESRPASFHKALDRALFLVLAADRLFIVGELKTAVRSLIGLTHATIMTAERLDLISERIWLASQFGNLREYISEMEAEMSRIAG